MKFSHLHNHTQFSLLDGASNITRLFDKAIKDNMPAMAITDHGNMFGVFEFVAQAWKKTKVVGKTEEGKDIIEPIVKPIIGCEFYIVENRFKQQFTKLEKDKRYHQLLIAKDEKGYQNLVKLCSLGYIDGLYSKFPRIDKELILEYHEGLIATTCCIGALVPKAIIEKNEEEAEKEFKWWLDIFGNDYYIEIQRHDLPDQIKINNVLLKFAEKYNVPIIATNDSHYVNIEDHNAHDILLCINTGEKQSTPIMNDLAEEGTGVKKGRFGFNNHQYYFKTTEEMSQLFSDIPQAIENTSLIVDKIKPLKLEREILLPHFIVPNQFNNNQDSYLEHITWEGAKKRYQTIDAETEERIKFELGTIKTMGFAGYFLIVADFIKAGRDMGVFIGPGRGSAAGSVVAYCIGITNIDPIKYNLLFERFLNPDRKTMPDIDTDFEDEGRQKVIDYVVDKYGKNQVAQIITYGTMAAKSSIKDVARVLDLPLSDANILAKLVPEKPGISLKRILRAPIETSTDSEKSLKEKEELKDEDIILIKQLRQHLENEDTLQSIVLKEAEKLEGSVRNTGIHAAGIIIAPSDLTNLLPVCTNKDTNLLITQFEGNVIENAGVIKMDFLGLKNLSIIKNALTLIKSNHNVEIDIDNIPLDDEATFQLYQRGDTNATFQFESAGMKKYLRDLKPDKFADLIAMNALYRPGPIQYIPNFIRRKNGEEEIKYDLPVMEDILADTYGVTVYQEQVMLLSQKIADFSKGDADVLRKAMGKKDKDTLAKMKYKFLEGAKKNQHPEDIIEKIWTDWEAFAQYAFNKSHSTCYAYVAYQTAYLKTHYPSEFMAAVLNNCNSIDKITFNMEECRSMQLKTLGPDINESNLGFSVNKNGDIRFGLNAIKGVGENAVQEILNERKSNGPFSSIFDLVCRTNQRSVNKKSLENLILSGAFDSFQEIHRAQYFLTAENNDITNLETIIRFGNQVQADKQNFSNSLFGDVVMPDVKYPTLIDGPQWSITDLLEKEKEVVGIYISAHPLDTYSFELNNYYFTNINEIEENVGVTIRVAGYITDTRELYSKKGDPGYKFTLNDYTSKIDIVLWNENYLAFHHYAQNNFKVIVTGIYEKHKYKDIFEFKVSKIQLLEHARSLFTKKILIYIPLQSLSQSIIDKIHSFTTEKYGVDFGITIIDLTTSQEISLKNTSKKLNLSDELITFLEENGIEFYIQIND